MPKQKQQLNTKKIEKLLRQQTDVILDAVDDKLLKHQRYIDYRTSNLEKRLDKMEMRINQKIDKLITTLDKFLKRLTDIEDEFTLMKEDIKRVKRVIKEKLGVDLE
ncbi:hypothetical protein J7K44_01240 [bacterium]|nr:hypothetical protein [bacterium]